MSRSSVAEKAAHASERAREILDDAPAVISRARSLVSGDSQFFSAQPKLDQITKQLASDSISDKRDGMKRIIANICQGMDMSRLFPDVVKNIHASSIEVRKLVYIYVVHYSHERQNEALLSISAFQKDLVDPSMHVRSLALRMLCSMRIPAINPVVMVAVKKCATDIASVVRKTAAVSLSQVHRIGGGDARETTVQILESFLGDRSPDVVGGAAVSFGEIVQNGGFALLHRHYRRICRLLVECDEWSQIVLMQLLLRYARSQFNDPNRPAPPLKALDSNGDDSPPTTDSDDDGGMDSQGKLSLDADHRLLLTCVKPLLNSLNRAVVVGAAALFFHVAPADEMDVCLRPLLRLLAGPVDGRSTVLSLLYAFSTIRRSSVVPHVGDFFIVADDTTEVRELKIRLVAHLTTTENLTPVLHEFRSYLRSFDPKRIVAALRGLAVVAGSVANAATRVLQLVSPLLAHRHADVIAEAVVVLRQLVVQGGEGTPIAKLVHRLLLQYIRGEIESGEARASVLWLIGENLQAHASIATAAPDVFRIGAQRFISECPIVKKQTLTLGCKLWLHLEGDGPLAERFKQIFFYVLELVKYDADYEIRDRGRMVACAVDRERGTFALLRAAMMDPKPQPYLGDQWAERARFQLGSLSHYFGVPVAGYIDLPAWGEDASESAARDPVTETMAEALTPDTSDATTTTDDDDDNDDTSDDGEKADSDSENGKVSPATSKASSSGDSSEAEPSSKESEKEKAPGSDSEED